jgi:hypothetical protein
MGLPFLAIGYWLLAIGYWLLAIGYWIVDYKGCHAVIQSRIDPNNTPTLFKTLQNRKKSVWDAYEELAPEGYPLPMTKNALIKG